LRHGADLPRQAMSNSNFQFSLSALSVADHLLEFVDFIPEPGVTGDHAFNLANGVKNRRVIAPAEAAADFGQRAMRHLLGEIHADLARPDDRAMTALREEVALRHAEMARDDAE